MDINDLVHRVECSSRGPSESRGLKGEEKKPEEVVRMIQPTPRVSTLGVGSFLASMILRIALRTQAGG